MLISHSKKFIFIHNYKVAGTSVRDALNKYANRSFLRSPFKDKVALVVGKYPKIYSEQFDGHITASELKSKIPDKIFNSYFKFGFVRNPWDWQVSLYTYMLKDETHYQHKLIKSMRNFEAYLDWRVNRDLHFQHDFFYRDDTCLVDFIGKIENLNADFNFVSGKIGIHEKLGHLKKSRENNSIEEYYSQKTIDLVNEVFIKDITLFGYVKPELYLTPA